MAMDFPKTTIDVNGFIELAKSVQIIELYLFGSVLRDDFGPQSDIDILVRFSPDSHYSLFDLFDIREKFQKFFNRKVDLVEIDSLRNPYRRENILGHSRKIYAA